jgi:quinol monooxygenase YgiN
MSVTVVVDFVPRDGCAQALRDALVASVPAVHDEEGCALYSLHADPDGRIVMIESWTSAALLDRHGPGAAVAALDARIDGLLASAPVVRRLEPVPAGTDRQGRLPA